MKLVTGLVSTTPSKVVAVALATRSVTLPPRLPTLLAALLVVTPAQVEVLTPSTTTWTTPMMRKLL